MDGYVAGAGSTEDWDPRRGDRGGARLLSCFTAAFWAHLGAGGYEPPRELVAAASGPLAAWVASGLSFGAGGVVPLGATFEPTTPLALYIFGAAGAGKSSFVRHLVSALALAVNELLDPQMEVSRGALLSFSLSLDACKGVGWVQRDLRGRRAQPVVNSTVLLYTHTHTQLVPAASLLGPRSAAVPVDMQQVRFVKHNLNKPLRELKHELQLRPNNNDLSVMSIIQGRRQTFSQTKRGLVVIALEEVPPEHTSRLLGGCDDGYEDPEDRMEQEPILAHLAERFRGIDGDATLIPVLTSNYRLGEGAAARLAELRMFRGVVEVEVKGVSGAGRAALASRLFLALLAAQTQSNDGESGGSRGGSGADGGLGGSGDGASGGGGPGGKSYQGGGSVTWLEPELGDLDLGTGDTRLLILRLRVAAFFAALVAKAASTAAPTATTATATTDQPGAVRPPPLACRVRLMRGGGGGGAGSDEGGDKGGDEGGGGDGGGMMVAVLSSSGRLLAPPVALDRVLPGARVLMPRLVAGGAGACAGAAVEAKGAEAALAAAVATAVGSLQDPRAVFVHDALARAAAAAAAAAAENSGSSGSGGGSGDGSGRRVGGVGGEGGGGGGGGGDTAALVAGLGRVVDYFFAGSLAPAVVVVQGAARRSLAAALVNLLAGGGGGEMAGGQEDGKGGEKGDQQGLPWCAAVRGMDPSEVKMTRSLYDSSSTRNLRDLIIRAATVCFAHTNTSILQ